MCKVFEGRGYTATERTIGYLMLIRFGYRSIASVFSYILPAHPISIPLTDTVILKPNFSQNWTLILCIRGLNSASWYVIQHIVLHEPIPNSFEGRGPSGSRSTGAWKDSSWRPSRYVIHFGNDVYSRSIKLGITVSWRTNVTAGLLISMIAVDSDSIGDTFEVSL
jgi:hypothetical protein